MLSAGTVLCVPTAPDAAPRLRTPASGLEDLRECIMRLTCVAGLAGAPQVTLPLARIGTCPVGLSLIGTPGTDRSLLRFAARLAAAAGSEGGLSAARNDD